MEMKKPYCIYNKLRGQEGFTIVELLVAVAILVFISVALLQTARVNIEFNTKNAIRDEGVRLAGEMLDEMRTASISNIDSIYHGVTWNHTRRVRNIDFPYEVLTTVSTVGSANKKIDARVQWTWKGEIFNATVSSVR